MKIKTKYFWQAVLTILIIILILRVALYFVPIKTISYRNRKFTFRQDIKDVNEIPVLNNEKYIHSLIWNPYIRTIKIIYQPNVTNPGYYSLETYELANKLSAVYILNGKNRNFEHEQVESYDNLYSTNELKIVLVHPDLTNESYIKVPRDNIIYIAGKDLRDFDLATIKLILIAMEYEN